MKKLLGIIGAIFLFLFVFIHQPLAITKTSGDLQVTHDEPLFPDTQVWYPGLIKHNTIEVKNLGGSIRGLGIKATNSSQIGGLADVLIFKVDDGGQYVLGGNDDVTLRSFWDRTSEFEVANLGPYDTKIIGFTVIMPSILGNGYQGTRANFDLIIGFLNQSSVIFTASGGGGGGTATNPSTPAVLGLGTQIGFIPYESEEVLGEATESAELNGEPTPTTTVINVGQVKGLKTILKNKIFIFGLPIAFILLLIAIFLKRKRKTIS